MEKLRLEAVRKFLELQLRDELNLQDIVFLASEICQTPIASITFVDDKQQYPIIGKGPVVESSSDIAFCSHTICQDTILEITDASRDPRFLNNPLVTDEPHIRFYAGAPLKTSVGYTVGSLCVIDQQPKKLTEGQLKSLEILSKQVMHHLELHAIAQKTKDSIDEVEQNMELLEHAEIMKSSFFDNCEDYFLLLNNNLEVVSYNVAAENLINKRDNGAPLHQGKEIFEYLHAANVPMVINALNKAKEGQTVEIEILVNPALVNAFWNKFSISPAYNRKKELIGLTCIGCNIQKEKKQEEKIGIQNSILHQIAHIHAHEIRHPLTNILAIVDLIKHDGVLNKQYLEYLETASKELDDVITKIVLDSHQAASKGV